MKARIGIVCLAFAIASSFALAACTPSGSQDGRPRTPSPSVEASPAAIAAKYLGSTGEVEVLLQNKEIVYWESAVDATPTARGAVDVVALMGERYASLGRAIVLVISVPHSPRSGSMINVMWNPTDVAIEPGLLPPGTIPPHSVVTFVNRWIGGHPTPGRTHVISDVTTSALSPGSPEAQALLQQVRQSTGMR